jgi:hypothetical protein
MNTLKKIMLLLAISLLIMGCTVLVIRGNSAPVSIENTKTVKYDELFDSQIDRLIDVEIIDSTKTDTVK